MTSFARSAAALLLGTLALGSHAWAQNAPAANPEPYTPTVGQAGKDVVWVPTPQALVDRMLDMVKLTPQDRLVDLGSGDGRTVITAAKRGTVSRGIEYNPDLVAMARRAAQDEGVTERAKFEHADIFESDFSEATVITLFLLPTLNTRLRPILLDMPAGTRIVSNSFTMEDWQPDETSTVEQDCSGWCTAYKWIVPAKVAGTWRLADQELTLNQNYQRLDGTLRQGKTETPIQDASLDGNQIRFSVGDVQYTGTVNGDAMQGTRSGGGEAWQASVVSRNS